MSALRSRADLAGQTRDVCKWPNSDIERGQRQSVNKYGVGSELWPEPLPGTAEALDAYSLHIRDFTNRRGSDVDIPIRHANPD
jgi:hypothetical protein